MKSNDQNTLTSLSDKDLVVDTDNLDSLSSKWNSSISNINIGSINVTNTFNPLIQNGIGANLFKSLDKALKGIETSSISIATSIKELVNSELDVDQNGNKNLDKRTSFNNYGGSGSPSSNIEESTLTKEELEEAKKAFNDIIVNLDSETQINFINELLKISNNNLQELLCNEKASILLKEELLKSPNLTEDLKKIIAVLDQNEIQTQLKNIIAKGDIISNFSKVICTIFENNSSLYDTTVSKSAKNLLDAYSHITNADNVQKILKDVYDAGIESNYGEDVILFTRDFLDTISSETKTSVEELLSNSKYKDVFKELTSDLKKTFTYLDASSKMGTDLANQLYSNVILKEN